MVSAAKSSPHGGDGRHNRIDPVTSGGQTGWVGEVSAHHRGAKLVQCCIVGLRPYQAPYLVAVFAQQTDRPAAQLACPTDDEDHLRPPIETAVTHARRD